MALAAGVGVFIADRQPHASVGVALLVMLAALALLRWRSALATYALLAAGFFLLHSVRLREAPGRLLAEELGGRTRTVTAIGAIVTEPKVSPSGWSSFFLRLNSIELGGATKPSRATISVRWHSAVEFGDELKLTGVAGPVASPRNPGEFDMRAFLARGDVHTQLFIRYPEQGTLLRRGGGNPILFAAQNTRRWMQNALCRGLDDAPDVQALISGMVLGLRHQTTDDIEEPFQQTGTLHLFAVAGLHVGIVAQLLWLLAIVLRVPRRWAAALIIPLLLFYAAVTGLHVSSLRAATMSAFLLGGIVFERRAHALNSLAAAAVLILVCDTNQLFASGFQLSFAVVGAIILFSDRAFVWARVWSTPDPFIPRSLLSRTRRALDAVARAVTRAAAVSFAAWLGSLLLIARDYHLVTLVSIFANLVVVPAAFFVLAIGMITMLATPIALPLAIILNNANWLLGRIVIGAVTLFAQVPYGHFYVEDLHWPWRAPVELTALDFGAGAGVHLRTETGAWLFDTGPQRDYERVLRQYLHARGIKRIDGLVLSHGDTAHLGAASQVAREFRPRVVIDTAAPDRSRIHRALIEELAALPFPKNTKTAGEEWEVSPRVRARVLHPPPNFAGQTADDQALVVQLNVENKTRVLLMSDSGEATENLLLASGVDLRSDILVKGQHHSAASGTPAFLDAVQPKVIIASSIDFPQHERVDDAWAEIVRARGIQLFRQDESGAVTVKFFAGDWEAKAYLGGETFRSKSR